MRRRNTWKERCLSWQTGYSPQTTHIIGSKGHFVVFCCVGRSLGISAKSEVLWHLVEVFKAMYHLSPLTWLVTYITACIGRDRNSEATWLLTSTNIDSDNDNDFSTVRRFVSVLLAVCLSVCLSVCHTCVLYPNSYRCPQTLLSAKEPYHSSSLSWSTVTKLQGEPHMRGVK